MQDFRSITSDFSVSGALESGDMAIFHARGFKTIISNLPDEEVTNGFTSQLAKIEAESYGLRYIYMPANGATVTDQNVVDQFADTLFDADQPVIAHCKTGTRSAILWSMVSAKTTHPSQIIAQMEEIGFELDFLEDEFKEQWQETTQNSPMPQHPGLNAIVPHVI